MTRLHADAVEVRTRTAPVGPVPEAFRWRDRNYLVTEVLSRWTQSGGWWRGAAVAALSNGDGVGATGPARVDDRAQQWWRVEAAAGRAAALSSAGPGVYDLCFDEASSGWSLARVQD